MITAKLIRDEIGRLTVEAFFFIFLDKQSGSL